VRDPRINLTIDTQALTYEAKMGDKLFAGQFVVLFWEPGLFYIAGSGSQPGFSFYTNISFLRHSAFADIRADSWNFRATNADHCDCDGNPSEAPKYDIEVVGATSGVAPFRTTLKIVSVDSETLSTYMWCVGDRMVSGQTIDLEFTEPGQYRVEAEAFYNDIKADKDLVVEVTASAIEKSPDPDPINHPPSLQVVLPSKSKKNRDLSFAAVVSDPDGDAVLIEWGCSDGSQATGPLMVRSFAKGVYECSVKATDIHGASTTKAFAVVVPKK